MFVLFLHERRADFKARAILVLKLRTANLALSRPVIQVKVDIKM